MLRVALTLLLGAGLAPASTVPQPGLRPVQHDKQKREKFGASLKRLNWDYAKGVAAETRSEDAKSLDADAVKLETLLVTVDILVADRKTGRSVSGLTRSDFVVREDGKAQQIASFAAGGDTSAPRAIILIIDYSGSQAAYLDKSVEAAKTLVSQLGPRDEMAIVTDDIDLLVDFTRDRSKLASALDSLKKRALDKRRVGRSFQFSALFAALRELVPTVESRPIVIFQTDGDEAAALRDQPRAGELTFLFHDRPVPEYGLSDIFEAASGSRATIYSVITSDRLIGYEADEFRERLNRILERQSRKVWTDEEQKKQPGPPRYSDYLMKLYAEVFGRGQLAVERVAALSGGWTEWLERPEQAGEIYRRILSDINQRYVIGYYPTDARRDGKLRKVRIEVRGHPEYEVHGRTTYRAPEQR